MLIDSQKKTLKTLVNYLKEYGFFDIFNMHDTEQSQLNTLKINLHNMTKELRLIISFFTLGELVSQSEIAQCIPKNILDVLEETNLIQEKDSLLQTKGLRLLSHYGAAIFCDIPSLDAKRYYGTDSMMLGRLIQCPKGKVLDLCGGIGSQGILCAKTAESVISVELQSDVKPVFDVNAVLNDVEDRIEFRPGNFLTAVEGEKFDYVYCNPPFLPVPEKFNLPVIADGGQDGLQFTKTLLKQANNILKDNGQISLIGMCFGNLERPFLGEIEEIAIKAELNLQIMLLFKVKLKLDGRVVNNFVKMALSSSNNEMNTLEAYKLHFQNMDATYLYSFCLTARKRKFSEKSSIVKIKSAMNQFVNEFEDRLLA